MLFADDDVLTQWTMTEALTGAGYDVVSACRGKEAIDLLNSSAEFDLLITDIDLPDDVTGPDVAEYWRQLLPGRPVIYTGAACNPYVRLLDQHEIFLAKPFSSDTLLSTIELMMEDAAFRPFLPVQSRRSHHVH